ncbi:hypothetical protein ASZ78_000941 [Callipepla squamata]|uniref:Transmembrane protein n=1 Tax=Callipepla squamata TaxID=9009 RepID=A0A226MXV2_CALSU|nr:hypothetical protein ASZ78_000941 [Callipepla squamata]
MTSQGPAVTAAHDTGIAVRLPQQQHLLWQQQQRDNMALGQKAVPSACLVFLLLLIPVLPQAVSAARWRARGAGPLGHSERHSPVPEPGLDARGVAAGEGDAAAPRKDASTIDELVQRSSEILMKFLRDIDNEERGGTNGAEEETAQQEPLQEGSGDTQPVSDNDVQGTVLPGVDAGNTTTAPVGKAKLHIPVMKVVLSVLLAIQLTILLLSFIVIVRMWRQNPARKRERAASGPDRPGSNLGGDESRAELGEAAEENVHAQKSNNSSRPFFDEEFGSQWSRPWTYPSHQSRSSPTDSDSSTSKHNSMDFPENSGQYH